MSQNDIRITKFIKKVRRRITEQKVLKLGVFGAIAGFAVALIFSVIALIHPWYYAPVFSIAGLFWG